MIWLSSMLVKPRHRRALYGPFPGLRVIPTGGIGIDGLPAWFAVGVLAGDIGSELAPRKLVRDGRREEVARLAARFMTAARAARGESSPAEGTVS